MQPRGKTCFLHKTKKASNPKIKNGTWHCKTTTLTPAYKIHPQNTNSDHKMMIHGGGTTPPTMTSLHGRSPGEVMVRHNDCIVNMQHA